MSLIFVRVLFPFGWVRRNDAPNFPILTSSVEVFDVSSCSESYPIGNSPDSMANQFINLEKITGDNLLEDGVSIFRDKHTDVLYLIFISGNKDKGGITPIAEPDGTFLTYQEWKERNKTYGKENQE